MGKVISIGEIHRVSRSMIAYKKRMSAWPLLILIELSQYEGFYSIKKLIQAVDNEAGQAKTTYAHLYQPLLDLDLVEIRKVEGVGARFPSLQIKLKAHVHLIDSDDYDYPLVLKLLKVCRKYMAENRKTSPLVTC